MRPLPLSCKAWCQPIARRHITTRPATFANIKYELLKRPTRVWHDRLQISGRSKSTQLLSAIPGLNALTIPRHTSVNSPVEQNLLLPQGHHLLYFPSDHHTSDLLPDGTDADHSPGLPFSRRLWTGGLVSFAKEWKHHLKSPGHQAALAMTCREKVIDVRLSGLPPAGESGSDRTPGAGEKIFVDIRREYFHRAMLEPLISEERTLCFMASKTAEEITRDVDQASKQVRPFTLTSEHSQSFTLTPAALFRFSALTFNAHRIHLDPQYCREVEGYPDLLVHGPLLLVLMFSVLTDRGLLVNKFTYRNIAPVFVGEEIQVHLRRRSREHEHDVWIVGPAGDLRVKGIAYLEDGPEDLRTSGSTGVAGAEPGVNALEPDGTSGTDRPHAGSGKTRSNHTDKLASDHYRDDVATLRNNTGPKVPWRSTAKEPNKEREASGSRNRSTRPNDTKRPVPTTSTQGSSLDFAERNRNSSVTHSSIDRRTSSSPAVTGKPYSSIVARAGGPYLRSPTEMRDVKRPTRHDRVQPGPRAVKPSSRMDLPWQRSRASNPSERKPRSPSPRSPHSALQQAVSQAAKQAESYTRPAPAPFRKVAGSVHIYEYKNPPFRERGRIPLKNRPEDLSPADGAQEVVKQTRVTVKRQTEDSPLSSNGGAEKAGDAPEAGIKKLGRYLRSWIS